MNQYLPLKFPDEPDALTEVRLRAELRLLRSIVTSIQRIEIFTRPEWLLSPEKVEEFIQLFSPEVRASLRTIREELWRPEAVGERIVAMAPVEQIKPGLKARLLAVESYFIEKGWHLPEWKRPGWLR